MKTAGFVVLLAVAFGVFARTMFGMVRAARRGRPDPRSRVDQIPQRLWSVLVYFIGQKKVAREGPQHHTSKHHLVIFWGFLIITVGTVEMLIQGVVPAFSWELLMPDAAYAVLVGAIDIVNAAVLLAIIWAIARRVFVRPPLIPMNLDAALILGAIASLMVTHFLYHGYTIAAGSDHGGWQPVSTLAAAWLGPEASTGAVYAREAAYWLHIAIVLAFLNYLPLSKHIHLLGALPNIFFRNLSKHRLDMPKLDLDDEEQWGVGKVEQFSWKSLIDTYACTECARCSNYCPAYATDKNLSPMQLVHDIRYEMIDRDALLAQREKLTSPERAAKPDESTSPTTSPNTTKIAEIDKQLEMMPPLVGGRIQEDTLWACTSCGACQEVCPVFIEHPLKIIQMRQHLVLEQESVPADLARTFRNIERQQNPWGISNEDRMAWAKDLDVPTIADNPDPEYILWVGCAGAFDRRIIKQTRAMIEILHAAKVNYAVLGHNEACTGDPARRAGNEFLFEMQAEANVEALNKAKAKKVIASCPHCLHTLKNDYPQFGGNYEVIHHTQLIAHLFQTGALQSQAKAEKTFTYHDSCYLGRWNGEYAAPRQVLSQIGAKPKELTRSKQYGFCCGAGGGRMFMEEESPRVNENRTQEILDSGAQAVAVACPFCNIMLTDGMKSKDKENDVEVLDVAEVVAKVLHGPDANL